MVLKAIMKLTVIVLFVICQCDGVPINLLDETNELKSVPKIDLPKYEYSTFSDDQDNEILKNQEEIEIRSRDEKEEGKTFGGMMEFVKDGAEEAIDLFKDMGNAIFETLNNETTTTTVSENITEINNSTEYPVTLKNSGIDPVFVNNSSNNSTANRPPRQDEDDNDEEEEEDEARSDEDDDEEEEEEDGNMVTNLLSAFLGGLSRPDGTVDVEAITGLLGSLSNQNDDGSYDFSGLTDLLQSFFGGGGEDGGGSDFGAFLGGLLGAFIQGVANPPGAKGAGIFTGTLVTRLLPALSAPAPSEDEEENPSNQQLDSGGFLGGLLQSILGGSAGSSGSIAGGSSDSSNSSAPSNSGGGSKFQIFKAIFGAITSLFTSSSSSSSKSSSKS